MWLNLCIEILLQFCSDVFGLMIGLWIDQTHYGRLHNILQWYHNKSCVKYLAFKTIMFSSDLQFTPSEGFTFDNSYFWGCCLQWCKTVMHHTESRFVTKAMNWSNQNIINTSSHYTGQQQMLMRDCFIVPPNIFLELIKKKKKKVFTFFFAHQVFEIFFHFLFLMFCIVFVCIIIFFLKSLCIPILLRLVIVMILQKEK